MPKLPNVKLFKQVKVEDKWVLPSALFDSKNRVRRDRVLVGGKDELHTEGASRWFPSCTSQIWYN